MSFIPHMPCPTCDAKDARIKALLDRLEESQLMEIQAREALGRLSLALGHPALEVDLDANETWPGKLIDFAIMRLDAIRKYCALVDQQGVDATARTVAQAVLSEIPGAGTPGEPDGR